MLNTLKNRLTLSLIFIAVMVGAAAMWIGQWGMQRYYEELTQTLNRDIAMYVTEEHKLLETKLGTKATIQQLSRQAMIINPIAEVYLLNPDGSINSHAQDPELIKRQRVDLAPIKTFLSGQATFPLRGNDPHHLDHDKVFSVSEVRQGDQLKGYLYVILGGQRYDQLQAQISWSHIRQQSLWAMALIVTALVLTGILVFQKQTRPLAKLTQKMRDFSGPDAASPETPKIVEVCDKMDDIGALDCVFEGMTQKIESQIEQLKESDRLRRELISNVSHDLRTPLATIQGYLETLIIKGEHMDAEQRQVQLRTAEKSCKRLARLIADLFELSKLESGSQLPDFEQFSLPELMHDTVQEFSLELERKNLTLDIAAPTSNTLVFADIGLIQRVLENLIRNAITHTPAHGRIQLNFSETPNAVEVFVKDTGDGINEADVPYIFERFYQSSDTPNKTSDSSGLGLAIVKRILDLHGCRIEVHSMANLGTEFKFELPTTPPNANVA